jgi:hypothetical protein
MMTRLPDKEMSSIVCLCKFMNDPLVSVERADE